MQAEVGFYLAKCCKLGFIWFNIYDRHSLVYIRTCDCTSSHRFVSQSRIRSRIQKSGSVTEFVTETRFVTEFVTELESVTDFVTELESVTESVTDL